MQSSSLNPCYGRTCLEQGWIQTRQIIIDWPGIEEEATVFFSEGLNVIYGPSDTGKTFIVQCIDFIFGGKKSPKAIPEASGYDKISLVISPWLSPSEYELTRSLKGGAITLSAEGSPPRKLSVKHSDKNEDSVSRFLLGLTGLDGMHWSSVKAQFK